MTRCPYYVRLRNDNTEEVTKKKFAFIQAYKIWPKLENDVFATLALPTFSLVGPSTDATRNVFGGTSCHIYG